MRRMVQLIFALALCLPAAPATAQDRSETTHDKTATIDFLDVGQGDAILIRSPEGKTALIDAGPSKEIVRLIRERGVKSIDLVVVSHHHADHYGGMDAVIKTFRPRFFLATDSSHTTPHYLKLLRLVRDSGITAIFPTTSPRKIELGSVVLTVMPQPPENLEDENDNSIGIRVQHGSCSLLLTGDSQAEERAFWERYVPDLIQNCTVLKLRIMGARTGLTPGGWGPSDLGLPSSALGRGTSTVIPARKPWHWSQGCGFRSCGRTRMGRSQSQAMANTGNLTFNPIHTGTAWRGQRKASPSESSSP